MQYKQKSNCKHIKIYKIITKAENSTVVLAIWGGNFKLHSKLLHSTLHRSKYKTEYYYQKNRER